MAIATQAVGPGSAVLTGKRRPRAGGAAWMGRAAAGGEGPSCVAQGVMLSGRAGAETGLSEMPSAEPIATRHDI